MNIGLMVGRLRRAISYMQRVAAMLIVVAGAYIIYYWLFRAGLIGRIAGSAGLG